MIKKVKGTLITGLVLIFGLSCVAYAAETTLTSVTTAGTTKEIEETDYYTSDVEVLFKGENSAGIKKAELIIDDEVATQETLEGFTQFSSSLTIDKDFLAEHEKANYKYEGLLKLTDNDSDIKTQNITFYADASKPEIKIEGVEKNKEYSSNVEVKIAVTDKNMENLKPSIKITKDEETIVEKTTVADCKAFSKTFSEEGTYKIIASGKDLVGHETEKILSFSIDKTGPAIKSLKDDGDKKEGYTWYNGDVNLIASIKDETTKIDRVLFFVEGNTVKTLENIDEKETIVSYTISKEWLASHKTETGKYTYKVRAIDTAGNVTNEESEFYAAVTTPQINIGGVTEGAIIKDAPTITAKGSEETTAKVDMTIKKGDIVYQSITEEKNKAQFTPEEDGIYTITAALTDKAGNKSEEKSISFTYDATAPFSEDGIKLTGSQKKGYDWYWYSVTVSASVKDKLSGVTSFRIDVNDTKVEDLSFNATSHKSVSELLNKDWFEGHESSDGKYDVKITAKDKAGNTCILTETFYADVQEPTISISGITNNKATNTSPTIVATATDNYPQYNTIKMTITKDGLPFVEKTSEGAKLSFEDFSKDGTYEIKAYSVDRAGNSSRIARIHFTKDTVAPVISISGPKSNSFSKGPSKVVAHVKEDNYKTVKVTGDVVRTLDGKKTSLKWGGLRPDKVNYSYTRKVNGTGTYTVTLEAVDAAGNKAQPKKLIFTLDNTRPIVKIRNVNNLNRYDSVVAPKIIWEDSYYASKTISLTRVVGDTKELSYRETNGKKGGSRTYSNFIKKRKYDDIYTLNVSVRDKAGNTTTVSKTFTVCRFGSTFSIPKASAKLNGICTRKMTDSVSIIEANPAGLMRAGGKVILDGTKTDDIVKSSSKNYRGWEMRTYTYPASIFKKEGVYELDTTSTDRAGNTSSFIDSKKSFKIIIDKTPPTITVSGVKDGGKYNTEKAKATIRVTDSIKVNDFNVIDDHGNTLYTSINEKKCPEEVTVQMNSGTHQTLTVNARDIAGNASTQEITDITVSDSAMVRVASSKKPIFLLAGILLALAVAIIFLIAKKKKRDDDDPEDPDDPDSSDNSNDNPTDGSGRGIPETPQYTNEADASPQAPDIDTDSIFENTQPAPTQQKPPVEEFSLDDLDSKLL